MNPTTREQLITATQAFLKDENICACVREMAEKVVATQLWLASYCERQAAFLDFQRDCELASKQLYTVIGDADLSRFL